uniref:SH2 domain-containing protein n=1 Tax=Steinernema glaseri TaxID=37863 RepID=A0A1I7YCU2_9BILA
MRSQDRTKTKCCSCAKCLCCKQGNGHKRKPDEMSVTDSSMGSGYESIPDVCTEDCPVEVPQKKPSKLKKEVESTLCQRHPKPDTQGPTGYDNPELLDAANKGKERQQQKEKIVRDLKTLQKEWWKQKKSRAKKASVFKDDPEERSLSDTGCFNRRNNRELMSVWSAFDLSNPENAQLRRSYPDPHRKKKDSESDTVYEKVDPDSLKEPPTSGAMGKQTDDSEPLGSMPGEFYLGTMKLADAQKAVTEHESFKFYHRLPSKDFDNEDYSHMRDHLSLWIVFLNDEGRFCHYIVRQDRDNNGRMKWGIRNYSENPKKFDRFQELLKYYINNPKEIDTSRK